MSFFALLGKRSNAQMYGENAQAKIRAIYLFQIATLTDWPAQYKNGSFIIAVYGDDKVFEELKKNHGSKTVGSQPIKIKKFNSIDEIDRCHVIYISPDKTSGVSEIVRKIQSSSTLIATESTGMLKSGAVVNFVIRNNMPRYEVSKANATKYKLYLTSQVTEKAVNVE